MKAIRVEFQKQDTEFSNHIRSISKTFLLNVGELFTLALEKYSLSICEI